MADKNKKNKAIQLRKQGKSYSQIKDQLGVSKSTLSTWLKDLPLSELRLRELRDFSHVRIEKSRLTKLRRREKRLDLVYEKVSNDIGVISDRELLIAGFYLYWAEGGKTKSYTVTLSNTDPKMLRAFIAWMVLLGISKDKMYIRLHLYTDMSESSEITYWAKQLSVPKKHFRKSYIKKSKLSELTYITKGHGTCNVIFPGRDISEYILQGIKKIASIH